MIVNLLPVVDSSSNDHKFEKLNKSWLTSPDETKDLPRNMSELYKHYFINLYRDYSYLDRSVILS